MRQAYDYWQNQPGNYRAPGLATGACFSTGEMVSYWMAPLKVHPHSAVGRANSAARAFRFPPLNSPEHPSAALPHSGGCDLGAPRGGLTAQHLPFRCQLHGVDSRCSVGRSSQRPVTHRAQPAVDGGGPLSPIARHPQEAYRRSSRFSEGRRPL